MSATNEKPGPWARFFGHKATKVVAFLALGIGFSAALYYYAETNKGGITTGLEPAHLVAELNTAEAKVVFNPTLDDLKPKPFYLLICDGRDMFCQKQLAEDEKVAKLIGDTVRFYHLDPNKETGVYNTVHKAMEGAVGQHVPQAFPLQTMWKISFKFDGTEPKAGVALANMGADILPAGGVLQWITKSLTPKNAAAQDDQADAPDSAQPDTTGATKPDAAKPDAAKPNATDPTDTTKVAPGAPKSAAPANKG